MIPDWATGKDGRRYPIRSSPGYEVAFEGLTARDKDYLRRLNDGRGYTYTEDRASREQRVNEAAIRRAKPFDRSTAPRAVSPLVQEQRFVKKHKSRLY